MSASPAGPPKRARLVSESIQDNATDEGEGDLEEYEYESDEHEDGEALLADALDCGVEADVLKAVDLFGDGACVMLPTCGRARMVKLVVDARSKLSPETLSAWAMPRPLEVRLTFSGGEASYEAFSCDKVRVSSEGFNSLSGGHEDAEDADKSDSSENRKKKQARDPCIVTQQLERVLGAFWRELQQKRRRRGQQSSSSSRGAAAASAGLAAARRVEELSLCALERLEEDGALACTLRYAHLRLATLNDFCGICDLKHVFGSMLRPTVCTRALCAHQLSAFGEMLVGATSLATHAEVLDLLVATTSLAAKSPRAEDVLAPRPQLDASGTPGAIADVRAVLLKFPTFERINTAALDSTESGMKAIDTLLEKCDKRASQLLRWIIASNPAHLVSIPEPNRLQRLGTRHQFVMLSAPPEKQKRFDQLKQQHGSRFAWHGSRPENWHSILRMGLRNASGTKLQLNGAAYGNGIYLSTSVSYSENYSNMARPRQPPAAAKAAAALSSAAADSQNAFLVGRELRLIALCEVAQDPLITKNSNIWVAPNEDAVVTRFLFAFPAGVGGATGREPGYGDQSLDATFEAEVRACIAALQCGGDDHPQHDRKG